MYILCGSEGCDLGAVKWSPDVVSRSAKLGETVQCDKVKGVGSTG